MNDHSTTAASTKTPSDSALSPRLPYQTPRVQPLGEWATLTLVTSLPIGPGGMIFGGPTQA